MKTNEYLDTILDDAEKAQLGYFADNDVMREAVKKVLLAGIYHNGTLKPGEPADPLRNFALGFAFNKPELDNATIGADLRAAISGINSLEVAFSNIARYKPEPPRQKPTGNRAR